LGGCINGVHSSSYIAKNTIGLSLSDIVNRPAGYTPVDMRPQGLCIIKEYSYKKGGYYLLAENLCGKIARNDCIIYLQVDASTSRVVSAWFDKTLSMQWSAQKESNITPSPRCDEKILNWQDKNWREWLK